jgi:hypothetical protein
MIHLSIRAFQYSIRNDFSALEIFGTVIIAAGIGLILVAAFFEIVYIILQIKKSRSEQSDKRNVSPRSF